MKNLIRILALVLLGLSVTGCELFSLKFWQKVDKYRKKIGEKCCESSRTVYCVDKYGNRTY